MSATGPGARERLSPAVLLLIAAALVAGGLLAYLQSHQSFFLDEWDLLLHRRGFDADAFLRPHNEHIVVLPAIVYKAIQATLGMDSPVPYQLVSIATFVASAVLLFVWVRRRIGEWPALLAAVLILFGGAAYEDLLSAFQIGYFGSMAFGLAALLALERPSRRADVFACVALVLACSFSSLGLPFAVGAGVVIATGPERRARAWIVAVPLVLFALWWIGWGSDADTAISFESVAGAPSYMLAGLANTISALLGLAPSTGALEANGLDWGRPLLLALAALAAWRAHAIRGGSRWLWAVAAVLLAFWFLAALNAALFRPPTSPRYTYIGAVLVLMVVAELLRGTRPPRWAAGAVFVVAAVAIAANAVNLRDGYRTFETLSTNERAGVSAIELARDTVDPGFLLTQENSDAPFFDYVDAESYLSAVDAFGSPGYSEPELLAASEHVRIAADKALAAAERIAPAPASPPAADDPRCRELAPDAAGNRVLELGPGTATLAAGPRSRLRISARRYSPEAYPVALGSLAGGEAVGLAIPQDRGEAPWTILIAGEGTVRVCEG